MQKLLVASAGLLIAFTLLGCGGGAAGQSTGALYNRQLETQVLARLNSDPDIRAAHILADVDVDKMQVTLSGTVKSAELREAALDLAKAAHPGITVKDEIQVKPEGLTRAEFTELDARNEREAAGRRGDKIGRSVDDAWIHLEVVSKLTEGEWAPEGRNMHVDVVEGTVTVRGEVADTGTKKEITGLVSVIKGVKRLVNDLKVLHP